MTIPLDEKYICSYLLESLNLVEQQAERLRANNMPKQNLSPILQVEETEPISETPGMGGISLIADVGLALGGRCGPIRHPWSQSCLGSRVLRLSVDIESPYPLMQERGERRVS